MSEVAIKVDNRSKAFKKIISNGYAKINAPYITPDFLNTNHIQSLDGWRAIAILMVVLNHAKLSTSSESFYFKFATIFIQGGTGVRIFFVLSGFLITTLLIKEFIKNQNIDIKYFFIKRTLRIFPVLYLYLLVIYLINHICGLNLKTDYFLGPLLYLTNFDTFKSTWLLGHTWSLAVEEQFYIIWPFLFWLLKFKLILFCIFICISMPFLNTWWYYNPSYFQITLAPFISNAFAIFIGALIAQMCFKGFFNSEQKIWSSKITGSICVFIVLAISYLMQMGIGGIFTIPFGSFSINILIGILLLQSILNQNSYMYLLLNNEIMIKIGVISYSLYIWQQLFIIPIGDYPGHFTWSMFPFNIGFSFFAAYISYYYYEVHFLKMKKKFTNNSI